MPDTRGWRNMSVPVDVETGTPVKTEQVERGLSLFHHDPGAYAMLCRIARSLERIDSALGDVLDSIGQERSELDETEDVEIEQ